MSIKVIIEVERTLRATVETSEVTTYGATEACFSALLGAGWAPENVIGAFEAIASDHREAWFPMCPDE